MAATGSSNHGVRRKTHIGIDADPLEVRTLEMTSNRIGDPPVLPDLLAQIPAEERIGSITADGIYDTGVALPPSPPEVPMPRRAFS